MRLREAPTGTAGGSTAFRSQLMYACYRRNAASAESLVDSLCPPSLQWARRPRRYTPHAPSYYDTRRPLPLSPPHSTASHAPGNGRGRSLSPGYGSGRGVSHRYDNRDRRDDRDQHDARGRENDRDHREDYERDRRRSVSPPARRDDAGQGGRFVEYIRSHSDNNRHNRGYDDRRARHRGLSSSRSPQPRQHDSDSRR